LVVIVMMVCESRGQDIGDEFEAAADDVWPDVGLVRWVRVYGRQWSSLDDLVAGDQKQGYN
jgi:hypothetical protein